MSRKVISIHRSRNRIAYLRRKERDRQKPHVDRVLRLLHQLENIEGLDELSVRRLLRLIKMEISIVHFDYGFEYLMYQAMLNGMWKNYGVTWGGSITPTLTPTK